MPAPIGPGHRYDVVVVGAGIAGSEAAFACARGGLDVLLVTTSLDTVYNIVGDRTRLEPPRDTLMRRLVRDAAGADGRIGAWALHRAAKAALEALPSLHLLQSNVDGLLLAGDGRVRGVRTWEGVDRLGACVALCAGSFLRARLTVGALTERAGRLSEMAYDELYLDLERHGLRFREAVLDADPQGGALPYRVACRVLDDRSLHADGVGVRGLPGLAAAGVCARGSQTFEASAADGARLARVLLARAAAPRQGRREVQ